jgi:Asp/Glu/hydantoin racemase
MVARAVASGARIGVVATNPATLEPSARLLNEQAARAGKSIEVELKLVEHAFAAVLAGDGATHDRLVRQAVLDLAPSVDVIVLAQASMARVLDVLPESERPVPVLSSPHLALEQARAARQSR